MLPFFELFSYDDECAFEAFASEVAVILRRRSLVTNYLKYLADVSSMNTRTTIDPPLLQSDDPSDSNSNSNADSDSDSYDSHSSDPTNSPSRWAHPNSGRAEYDDAHMTNLNLLEAFMSKPWSLESQLADIRLSTSSFYQAITQQRHHHHHHRYRPVKKKGQRVFSHRGGEDATGNHSHRVEAGIVMKH
jgi:hypothetical protein